MKWLSEGTEVRILLARNMNSTPITGKVIDVEWRSPTAAVEDLVATAENDQEVWINGGHIDLGSGERPTAGEIFDLDLPGADTTIPVEVVVWEKRELTAERVTIEIDRGGQPFRPTISGGRILAIIRETDGSCTIVLQEIGPSPGCGCGSGGCGCSEGSCGCEGHN